MNVDYARAYGNERIAHAQIKQRQREAVQLHKANRGSSVLPIRSAMGNWLIARGEWLSATRSPVPSTAKGNT